MKHNGTQAHRWNTADTITSMRIAASLFLLCLPLRSVGFFAVYTITGLTDTLDGYLARKTGTASDFGAMLDSIADLLFYGIVLYRLAPVLWQKLPVTIWYAVAVILLVRLAAYTTAAIKYHKFAALHTWLNKLTGIGIFFLPYALVVSTGVVYSWSICVVAFATSLEELAIHLCRKDYASDKKSVFLRETEKE